MKTYPAQSRPRRIWLLATTKLTFLLGVLIWFVADSCFAGDAATNSAAWQGVATNAQGEIMATITVDTLQTPDLADWGKEAGALCAAWYPKICVLLASDDFTPPNHVWLRFRDGSGVAGTSADVITINAHFIRHHPDDRGMVIHELTHVVQSYHHDNPGWLVEGIADYIRLAKFEPQAPRPGFHAGRDRYTDGYKTTALFLEWIEQKHDAQLVKKLNAACRAGTFRPELFKEFTGKTVDELWQDYADSHAPMPVAAPAH